MPRLAWEWRVKYAINPNEVAVLRGAAREDATPLGLGWRVTVNLG